MLLSWIEAYFTAGLIFAAMIVVSGAYSVTGFPRWLPGWLLTLLAVPLLWLPAILTGGFSWKSKKIKPMRSREMTSAELIAFAVTPRR